MQDKLKYIFENTNNWLNFAEAKNAAILAFNIALIAAITSTDILENYVTIMYIIIAILTLSSIVSVLSFVPKTNNSFSNKIYKHSIGKIDKIIEKIFKDDIEENLLFYGYISQFEIGQSDEYLQKMISSYDIEEKDRKITGFEKELAEEIIINSRITQRKYNYFKASMYILIIGMILLLVILILCA